jgi:hypothetical protein
MLSRAIAILVSLTVLTVGANATSTSADVTGDYASNWDDVKLVREGSHVHGTYVCCGGGTIEGKIYQGRIIRYHWKQPGGEGEGIWEIVAPDRIEGTWGSGQSDNDGGRWDLQRKLPN